MNIYQVQQDIVAQIQSAFTSAGTQFLAKDVPESPNDYIRALQFAIAYVIYTGSVADPSISTRPVFQKRRLGFNVEIQGKSLYSPNGIYVARDIVEQAIIGFAPVNCHQIYLKSDEISQLEETIWVHVLKIECETNLVQKDDSDPIVVPQFKELINED